MHCTTAVISFERKSGYKIGDGICGAREGTMGEGRDKTGGTILYTRNGDTSKKWVAVNAPFI